MHDFDQLAIDLLKSTKVIAVVGLSDQPDRPSHYVSQYMLANGYEIIPVNPAASTILGRPAFPDLNSIPGPVDMVNIFRRPEAVPAIVDEALAIGAKSIWMQEGVIHEQAADKARQAGVKVIMDRCLLKEHQRMLLE